MATLLAKEKLRDYPMFFMIVGIVTNFVDFLTVPLITLGMPLLIVLMLEYKNGKYGQLSTGKKILFIAAQTCAWGMGYAGCWISKWILAALILPGDITESVLGHASFWLSDAGAGTRLWAFRRNIPYYFAGQGVKIALFALLLPIFIILKSIKSRKKSAKPPFSFLIVSVFPYIWYLVLNGHSFYHAWFTYRAQAITLFGICLFFLEWMDMDKKPAI